METYKTFGYVAEFDGLRAIAILFVMAHHLYLRWPSSVGSLGSVFMFGWMGVDLFFVISGFLITGILLQSQPGRAGLVGFYQKRVFRIWPLYYICLLFVALDAWMTRLHFPLPSALVFCQNFLPSWPAVGLEQTWSLCIEEHFYLIWPLFILFGPRRLLLWLLGAVLVASPLLRWWALTHSVSTKLLYTSTQYRLDAIAWGSLIGVVYVCEICSRAHLAKLGQWILPFAVILLVISCRSNSTELGQRSALGYTCIALLSAAVLCSALNPTPGLLSAMLTWAPLRWVGRISYSIYMIQPLVFRHIGVLKLSNSRLSIAAAIALSFIVSALSWLMLEKPFIQFGRRWLAKSADARQPFGPQPREDNKKLEAAYLVTDSTTTYGG